MGEWFASRDADGDRSAASGHIELPQEIAPELKSLASRIDKQRTERYADIVGTC
jgi:hypothetical protein